MTRVQFIKPWRAHKAGAVVSLKPKVAEELAAGGCVKILGEETPAPAEASTAGQQLIADEQKLTAERDEWRRRAEAAEAKLAEIEGDTPPPTSTPVPADAAIDAPADDVDPATLFPELKLSESLKLKMADTWSTTQQVIDHANEHGTLTNTKGIGKVAEQAIKEAILEAGLAG